VSRTMPTVAVIGRQNVGKSTLVNRVVGRREAIAHESAGVTRDRLEIPVEWRGRRFVLVDTGGLMSRPRGVEAAVVKHALQAAEEADLILLMEDGRIIERGTHEQLMQARGAYSGMVLRQMASSDGGREYV